MVDAVFKTDKAVFNFRVAGVWIVDQHVLLHKDINDVYWSLPGGRVSIGEETQASIVREFQEELGVQVHADRLLWTNENFFHYRAVKFHEIAFYYKVSVKEPVQIKKQSFYGLEGERLIYQWVSLNEINDRIIVPEFLKEGLPNLPLYPEHIIVKSSI